MERIIDVLNIDHDSAVRAKEHNSIHMKIFYLLKSWYENNTFQEGTNVRAVLLTKLKDYFLHDFSECFWKKNQELHNLAKMIPLEEVIDEVTEENIAGVCHCVCV